MLSPYAQDVYGCLLNNGVYAFQRNCRMDVNIGKAALGCYYGIVRSVYIQSPQVAYVDICPGNELTSQTFVNSSSLEFIEHLFRILQHLIAM